MVFNIIEFGFMLAPVSVPHHTVLSSIAVAITNIMACRVFRKTKQALVCDEAFADSGSSMSFAPGPGHVSFMTSEPDDVMTESVRGRSQSKMFAVGRHS
jgi:hypothetical protein